MSFFPFSNIENARQQNRNKLPKIDIDLDPIKMFTSFFSPKSNAPNVRSCCESCSAKFSLIRTKVSLIFYSNRSIKLQVHPLIGVVTFVSQKVCNSCKFEFCNHCYRIETDLGATRSSVCLKCRIFARRPLKKEDLNRLKVKDLKWFLRSHRISSNLCRVSRLFVFCLILQK